MVILLFQIAGDVGFRPRPSSGVVTNAGHQRQDMSQQFQTPPQRPMSAPSKATGKPGINSQSMTQTPGTYQPVSQSMIQPGQQPVAYQQSVNNQPIGQQIMVQQPIGQQIMVQQPIGQHSVPQQTAIGQQSMNPHNMTQGHHGMAQQPMTQQVMNQHVMGQQPIGQHPMSHQPMSHQPLNHPARNTPPYGSRDNTPTELDQRQQQQQQQHAGIKASPRTVPTRMVEGGMSVNEHHRLPGGGEVGFQPIQEIGVLASNSLPSRTPPRGAESPPKPTSISMTVPQIGNHSN